MYTVKKSVLRKIWVFLFLLVLLTSCDATNTGKTFEYAWSDSAKTTCTPLYNEDGFFVQSSCKTYCQFSVGSQSWVPANENVASGKYFEVLLPIENESQFIDFAFPSDRNLTTAAFCSSLVEFDNGLSCLGNARQIDDPNPGFLLQNCSYTCPRDGFPVNVVVGKKEDDYTISSLEVSQIDTSALEDKYCPAPPLEAPTDEPPVIVEAPTEAPTEEPAASSAPILTGDVTYCDIVSRSVNLRLVEGFSAEEFNHQVTMGREAMSCKVNEGNATLLTCTFPATTKFPTSIQVSQDGNIVNEFEYDGSNCVVPEVNKDTDEEAPQESPAGGGVVCDPVHLPAVCIPLP